MKCDAIFTVNEELHSCLKDSEHRGQHKTRFTTTSTTDLGIPYLVSEVTMRWTRWAPTNYSENDGRRTEV